MISHFPKVSTKKAQKSYHSLTQDLYNSLNIYIQEELRGKFIHIYKYIEMSTALSDETLLGNVI